MLMHCFWLLEFKFAFEFNCLIFSLNLSKFRSLEKAPDLSLLKAQPSYRGPSAEVRRSPLDFSASLARRRSFGSAAAQQRPAFPGRPVPHLSSVVVANTRGLHVIVFPESPSRRTRT